eukprot:TRINITY_DN25863_c0_g1_i1.p1 TRINITY_DN25863_c0_g1~~TRINITY_DN25863_c0_g1_i1.p1  ORF type:complete len:461 (-),score=127.79 TRINITY_DN25863_c0_g1_i1:38-1420(-)
MDKLVLQVQATNYTDTKDVKSLISTLNKSSDLLSKNQGSLDDFINTLAPATHTIGCIYALAAKLSGSIQDKPKFISQVRNVIYQGNINQIRQVPYKFSLICRKFAEILASDTPLAAVRPLREAIIKLKPSSHFLTPLHADFFQCCLLSHNYNAALPILSEEIYEIPNPDEYKDLRPSDLLRFFYYGGMLHLGLKNYHLALEFFKSAFTVPALILSLIMVESYKKYILTCLIAVGSVPNPPKYTSQLILRQLKVYCQPYLDLSTAYSTHSLDEMNKVLAQHHDVFTKDTNFGLVSQVLTSLRSRNIQRMTDTFLTLSTADIANNVQLQGSKQAEKEIMKMIEGGQIVAKINQKDGMVKFEEKEEGWESEGRVRDMDGRIERAMGLAAKMRMRDEDIGSSQEYLSKVVGSGGGKWGGGGGEMDDFDIGGGMRDRERGGGYGRFGGGGSKHRKGGGGGFMAGF